jgi:hypothetical protein
MRSNSEYYESHLACNLRLSDIEGQEGQHIDSDSSRGAEVKRIQ